MNITRRFLTTFKGRLKNHLDMLNDVVPHMHSNEALYVYDLGEVKRLYKKWETLFPGVRPFYAVKCNPDRHIIKTLAECGAGFDCASPWEVSRVLDHGVAAKDIIYANPCKKETDIAFMKKHGVSVTTFDSKCELEKMRNVYPECELVLRIYANDPSARCVLSNKYGALPNEWEPLLSLAQGLKLKVVGVSFHIGSNAASPHTFGEAIRLSRQLSDLGMRYGFDIRTIDIGGGFSIGNVDAMSAEVRKSLAAAFTPDMGGFKVIAEPGRFFCENVATLYTKIIGVRQRSLVREYFIADSIYGSFNNKLYDHASLQPVALHPEDPEEVTPSTIFGSTCDGFDVIIDNVVLPRLEYGSWIRWDNMGAYTLSGATDFNGINYTSPRIVYYDEYEDE